MRKNALTIQAGPDHDAFYCVLCDTYMLFERVIPEDTPEADWICATCGSALSVDPPAQQLTG